MRSHFIPYLTAAVMGGFFMAWVVLAIADGPAAIDLQTAIEGE